MSATGAGRPTAPARGVRSGIALLPLLTLLLAACGSTVKVLPEPLNCPLPEEVLSQACEVPGNAPPGATFEQVLQVAGRDRDALRHCAAQHRVLARAMRDCNQALDRYREQLRQINQQAQAKP